MPVTGTCSHLHFNNTLVISLYTPETTSVYPYCIHCLNNRGDYQFSTNLVSIMYCSRVLIVYVHTQIISLIKN